VHGPRFELQHRNHLTTRAFFLPARRKEPKFIQNLG